MRSTTGGTLSWEIPALRSTVLGPKCEFYIRPLAHKEEHSIIWTEPRYSVPHPLDEFCANLQIYSVINSVINSVRRTLMVQSQIRDCHFFADAWWQAQHCFPSSKHPLLAVTEGIYPLRSSKQLLCLVPNFSSSQRRYP